MLSHERMKQFVTDYATKHFEDNAKQIWLWNLIDNQNEPEPLWEAQIEACGLNPGKIDANYFLAVLHGVNNPGFYPTDNELTAAQFLNQVVK